MTGDCYARAGRLLLDLGRSDAFLVHGIVFHPKTGWHGHAWVEYDDKVFDRVEWDKNYYYSLGKVRNVKRYPLSLACELMEKRRHFGPWRLKK